MRTSVNQMPAELKDLIPRYRCHKIVRALKIDQVLPAPVGKDVATWCILVVADFPQPGEQLQIEYDTSRKPIPAPGWYWVFYEDGYESFSPCDAFESGYAWIDEVGAAS